MTTYISENINPCATKEDKFANAPTQKTRACMARTKDAKGIINRPDWRYIIAARCRHRRFRVDGGGAVRARFQQFKY